MLLIIFLGLIAKLTSVSGYCDVGTLKLNDFDYNKFSGPRPWYLLFHSYNSVENNLDCPVGVFSSPEGNTSLIINDAFDIREQRHITLYGYATNWNSSGYFEACHSVLSNLDRDTDINYCFSRFIKTLWNGQVYIVAINYERYVIIKHCPLDLSKPYVYVAFRSRHPDEDTVKEALKDLQDSNVDVNQLEMSSANHCQQVESSTDGGSSS